MLDSLLFLNYFNSRLCTRGNIDFNTHLPCKRYFNSRLYTRGDGLGAEVPGIYNISIHASAREPTQWMIQLTFKEFDFNSRLYIIGNPKTLVAHQVLFHFNSRLYTRGDAPMVFIMPSFIPFQFTPLHERQLRLHFSFLLPLYFNSCLYMRGNSCAMA